MRVFTLILLIVLGLSPSAWAGSVVFNFGGAPVTLATNAKQDDKLNRLLVEHNQGRTSAIPPQAPLTLEQFVHNILVEELKRLNQAAVDVESNDFCTVFATLSPAQQQQIITAGGNNSPCPD